MPLRLLLPLTMGLAVAATAARADEGMWTFDNFPSALVRDRYGVDLDDAWLDHVRLGTVRLQGCTGSFVSHPHESPLRVQLPRAELDARVQSA
jgi:hypothetical protein